MIPIETRYELYNNELPVIIKVFKILKKISKTINIKLLYLIINSYDFFLKKYKKILIKIKKFF